MTTIQTGDLATGFTPGNGWGLGWCVVREPQGVTEMLSPGTFGHCGAFGTQGWVDPKRKIVFVLMIQRTQFGNSNASDIRSRFFNNWPSSNSPSDGAAGTLRVIPGMCTQPRPEKTPAFALLRSAIRESSQKSKCPVLTVSNNRTYC